MQQVIGLTAFILVTVADFTLSTFPSIYAIETALSRIKHLSLNLFISAFSVKTFTYTYVHARGWINIDLHQKQEDG